MAELPLGTITLLFTDIDGSTRLLQRLGERYGDALSAQRAVMRRAVEAGGGHEMGTEGDSFFVVFDSARAAIRTCQSAQEALRDYPWPGDERVGVRMGLHTGEPLRHEDGYIGLDVHRAARIAAAAHGGQVLVSDTTRRLVADSLGPELGFVPLGRHRLKDLPELELLHQLSGPGLSGPFPPVRSMGSAAALPRFPAPMVGRPEELRRILRHASTSGGGPITLVGPGGSGKTRLAVEAAGKLARDQARAVYFVALETVTGLGAAWRTVAETVGAPSERDAPSQVSSVLTATRAAVILDNVEQIADAADLVRDLLNRCPELVLVVTSRRPLHLRGERVVDVGALSLADASRLFGRQASLARHGFRLDESNQTQVERVCDRLDRMPLAIELAAARTRLLSPESLLARLDLSLTGSAVDVPERHRSLRSTVAWSYDLLAEDQQRGLDRIGVFEGGGDLDSLGAVLELPPAQLFDLVETLADASLLQVIDGPDGEPRVGLLTSVRQFALERLAESGNEQRTRTLHAERYAQLVERAAPLLRGPNQLEWLGRLRADHANAVAALQWCLDASSGDPRVDGRLTVGLRIANGLMWFWYRTGAAREGARLLERLQDMQIGPDDVELVQALQGLAVLLLQVGESVQAVPILERSLQTWRARGDQRQVARALNSLGVAMRDSGQPADARRYLLESAEISRRQGDSGRLAVTLSNLSQVALDEQRADEAVGLLQESLDLDRRSGDRWAVSIGEANLAAALIEIGRLPEAEGLLATVASAVLQLGDLDSVADALERGVALRAVQGRVAEAGQLYGAAARLRSEAQLFASEVDERRLASYISAARSALPATEWEHAVEAGERLTLPEALELLRG